MRFTWCDELACQILHSHRSETLLLPVSTHLMQSNHLWKCAQRHSDLQQSKPQRRRSSVRVYLQLITLSVRQCLEIIFYQKAVIVLFRSGLTFQIDQISMKRIKTKTKSENWGTSVLPAAWGEQLNLSLQRTTLEIENCRILYHIQVNLLRPKEVKVSNIAHDNCQN